jgi:NlpC/P60 family putative phage cell wall peptidase
MTIRDSIIAEARSWIGTPYHHQAVLKGVGCDCLGLVRGVWRAVCGAEPEAPPPYTPDWAECAGREALCDAAARHLTPVALGAEAPGDVLLFRMRADAPMKHAGILSAHDRIIHAYWGRAVVENRLAPFWRARMAAAFSFPGAQPWQT